MQKTEIRWKKWLIILGVVLAVLILALFIITAVIVRTYARADIPEYTVRYYYEHYEKDYPREEVTLLSGENTLHAYIYGQQNDKALLVFGHGSGGFHEDYMDHIVWFVDHGYRVFASDLTGSGNSGGKGIMGMPQSAIDMDAILTYIENDPELSGMKKVLYGHSWGAYGVTAVLNFDHDVTAAAPWLSRSVGSG